MKPNRAKTAADLHRFYAAARGHFGYIDRWWPGTPLELAVTAVLVQRCDWNTAWKATKRLRAAGWRSLAQLAEAEVEQIRPLICPVAFASRKAARLIRIADRVTDLGCATVEQLLDSGSTDQVRQELLALPGIGEETADAILLFASDRHETFVVDAYARRLFQRLALLDGCDHDFWRRPYEHLRRFFQDQLTGSLALYDGLYLAAGVPRGVALLRDFHAQIVELGRHHCRQTNPRCSQRGWAGWKDADGDFRFCEGHCSHNGCIACPLANRCAAAEQPGRRGQKD
jgi:endonuclease III related protein